MSKADVIEIEGTVVELSLIHISSDEKNNY